MAIRSDKNIEALRIGIAEQERQRLIQEQSDDSTQRIFARKYVDAAELLLVPVIALLEGDWLVASTDGTSFHIAGTVRRIARFTEDGQRPAGDWWVTVDRTEAEGGSSYGHAFKSHQRVLIVDCAPASDRRPNVLREREEEKFVRTPGRVVQHESPAAALA